MCKLCDEGKPQDPTDSPRDSRRDFLKAAATGVAAAGLPLFAARPAAAKDKGKGKKAGSAATVPAPKKP